MLRSTSVVITTTGALPLMELSPVSRPTASAPRRSRKSPNFWLERAFSGVVYSARSPRAIARAIAASATTVFPEPVGAHTTTVSPRSMAAAASSWKGSAVKGSPAR